MYLEGGYLQDPAAQYHPQWPIFATTSAERQLPPGTSPQHPLYDPYWYNGSAELRGQSYYSRSQRQSTYEAQLYAALYHPSGHWTGQQYRAAAALYTQPVPVSPYAHQIRFQHSDLYREQAALTPAVITRRKASDHSWQMPLVPYAPPSNPKHPMRPLPPTVEKRGPPRKPKRSGHAIWVGNIPMFASIDSLKDHFSRGFTTEIESVFLMSKSNCAFVNYKTSEACSTALEQFNNSLFGPVRLLCRARRDSESQPLRSDQSISPPTDTDSAVSDLYTLSDRVDSISDAMDELRIENGDSNGQTTDDAAYHPSKDGRTEGKVDDKFFILQSLEEKVSDRFFILKSLTKEDIQESLRTGVWQTQGHNEKALTDAYRAANVYLIFSVNKSGEFFGYARMLSAPLGHEPDRAEDPRVGNKDNIRIIPTPATETAPRGYIIEDAARGTLFWEAAEMNGIVSSTAGAGMQEKPINRPFEVEWLSVRKVPFQRTKAMRNLWNENKEVKIARDGQELETEVGRKVVRLFHGSVGERRVGSP